MRIPSLLLLLLVLIFSAPNIYSQAEGSSPDPQFKPHQSPEELKRENERLKIMNKERAARIKRDTEKLLALATELKQYVDKTNENVLSVEVIRKADEIDKLAKSIREKMKEDYRSGDSSIP